MDRAPLLTLTEHGLRCEAGGFYVDAWQPVDRTIVTHAHGDHAHSGCGFYLTATPGVELLKSRVGEVSVQGLAYGERLKIGDVMVSLHPAGHILGSSQVRIEHQGEVWVVSGDYKLAEDPTCAPFEPVRCHTFLTESTFGLPVYRWAPAAAVIAEIQAWWQANARDGKTSLLLCYALGKAQRVLAGIDAGVGPIVVHGAVERINAVYRAAGVELAPTSMVSEAARSAAKLPDGTVLDGEILPWKDGAVLPFALLQRRIGRKQLTRKILEEVPAVLMAFDMLEHGGEDKRERPLGERRVLLERVIAGVDPAIRPSPVVTAPTWAALAQLREDSRAQQVEGLMLKRRGSVYGVGRPRGDWWKWKIQPHTIDAVLIYAQRGQGRRASLYTDYTFGVWQGEALVPFCKAYSGLTDAEIVEVDKFVREHTLERFGPVRVVEPALVFEIGFEGIARSARHKSGVAVRFPRMLRWRTDKRPGDADRIEQLQALLPAA